MYLCTAFKGSLHPGMNLMVFFPPFFWTDFSPRSVTSPGRLVWGFFVCFLCFDGKTSAFTALSVKLTLLYCFVRIFCQLRIEHSCPLLPFILQSRQSRIYMNCLLVLPLLHFLYSPLSLSSPYFHLTSVLSLFLHLHPSICPTYLHPFICCP